MKSAKNKIQQQQKQPWKALLAGALLLSIAGTGCGKEAFVARATSEAATAPGSFEIPAKVDIVLAQDDTGSMYEVYSKLKGQMPTFLNNIESAGWDYHFVTVPLTRQRSITQVAASRYDGNHPFWLPAFPGALQMSDIPASVFRTSSEYGGFISSNDISNGLNGYEPGLDNVVRNLENTGNTTGTGFLRQDAMLVVVVVGNGDDTSRINYCVRQPDNILVPCENEGKPDCTSLSEVGSTSCGSKAITLADYKARLLGLKDFPEQLKFFAAVGGTKKSNCLGGPSYIGSRYQQMASELNGQSYDVCTQSVTGVLSSLAANLQSIRIGLHTRYVFVAQDADESTIKVTKYLNGVTPVEIPHDANNGWTYLGWVDNVYAIDYPMPMNVSSGYAIELHGSAKLIGADYAVVDYKPAGLQSSH